MKSAVGGVPVSPPVAALAEDTIIALAMLEHGAKKLRNDLGGEAGKHALRGKHTGENLSFQMDRFVELTRLAVRARAAFMALALLVDLETRRKLVLPRRTKAVGARAPTCR